ncbi:MAG: hypothetical protein M3N00_08395 [Actinomycetota bacterium]|nr:hypothetical protein [Actinomycetota bacterium]
MIEKANTAGLLAVLAEDEVIVSKEAADFANPAYSWPQGLRRGPAVGASVYSVQPLEVATTRHK